MPCWVIGQAQCDPRILLELIVFFKDPQVKPEDDIKQAQEGYKRQKSNFASLFPYFFCFCKARQR